MTNKFILEERFSRLLYRKDPVILRDNDSEYTVCSVLRTLDALFASHPDRPFFEEALYDFMRQTIHDFAVAYADEANTRFEIAQYLLRLLDRYGSYHLLSDGVYLPLLDFTYTLKD